MASTTSKGHIWVGGVDGEMVPVPKVCPKCGRPTIRTGNRHQRRIYCEGYILHRSPTPSGTARDCDWRTGVYS